MSVAALRVFIELRPAPAASPHTTPTPRHLREMARRALSVCRVTGRIAFALAFTDDAEMRRLNRMYAGNDYATDVLSFPNEEAGPPFAMRAAGKRYLGDIAIALPTAERQAQQAGHSLYAEIDLLLTHGLLHLLGYYHAVAVERQVMERLQRKALQKS